MGGVDKHDKLRSTFSLGKQHKLKKYYVKWLLFLVDIALTNSWLYYKLVHEDITKQGGKSRFLPICCPGNGVPKYRLGTEILSKT